MAAEFVGGKIVKKAGADLTGKKYYGVKFDSNDAVVLAGAGEAIGVLIEEGKADESVTVQFLEGTKIVAAAAMASGAYATTDANGKFVAAVAGQRAPVMVLKAATSPGDVIPAVLIHGVAPVTKVSELTDVVLTELADAQILKYDGTAKVWENAADAIA
jgi:hypothetical protein